MFIDPKEVDERLKKALEVINQVEALLNIQLSCWVSDYDGTTYKVKLDDRTSNYVFRSIPREYFDDKDTLEAHAVFWVVLFKEIQEELNKKKGRW